MSKKMAKKVSPDKHKTMTITYDWNGGELTRNLTFPRVDLSYISPGSSDGIEYINFSGKNFEDSDLSYSNFFNCNFRNTNMKNVKMDKSNFRGSEEFAWVCIFVKKCGIQAYQTTNGTLHWYKKSCK